MPNFSKLPTEIWFLIALHIPRTQLSQLKSLNSFFLNCWMATRWKEITINTQFPDRTVHLLARVVDPFVITRTKTLTICFDARELLASSSSKVTFETALSTLLRCLPSMQNITSLKIDLFREATVHFSLLFRTIMTCSIARSLQSLVLSGCPEIFATLPDHSTHSSPFKNLTQLSLGLIDLRILDPFSTDATADKNSSRTVAPFLLFLRHTLQSLRISTGTIDLAPLFDALVQSPTHPNSDPTVPFPQLRSLFLVFLPCNVLSIQTSPQSFRRFLFIHRNTLQHLFLKFETNRIHPNPGAVEPLDAWFTELVDEQFALPCLQALDIYSSTTETSLSALLTLLKRTAPTVSSLTICNRYLTDEQAMQVLDALTEGDLQAQAQIQGTTTTTISKGEPRKLKDLRLDIAHLSVAFLDLLSRRLPQLENLALRVSDAVEHTFYDVLHRRRYDFSAQDSLHAWKLRDLSIRRAGRAEMRAVRAVAGAIPTLARKIY